MTTWTIGDVTITRIEEQLGFSSGKPEEYLRGLDRELLRIHAGWLVPNHYSPKADRLVTSIHSWLIRTPRHTILLDTCGGNHKSRPWSPRFHMLDTPWLARLADAGVRPEEIDIVMCSHLHADHVGWNTMRRDGRWVPVFPNARYLMSRREVENWDPRQNPAMVADPKRVLFEDSVLPVVESGQAVLIDDGYQVDSALTVEASGGHTPGHVSLALRTVAGRALFCGDCIHHPLQVYEPHINHAADEAPEAAARTRRQMLERCAGDASVLFPIHFGAPHVASIRARGSAFEASFVAGRAV